MNSVHLLCTQDRQYQRRRTVEPHDLTADLLSPPTLPLNPINPDNARILRITAAAGTELADAYSRDTCTAARVPHVTLPQKEFTTRRAFFLHATWLVQASAH